MDKNHSPLDELNTLLERKSAQERVEFAVETLPENYLLASSFGAQSAANLHLITQVVPNIPVVLLDTGYLFPETYQFVDQLIESLKLNVKVYQSTIKVR